jgi:hypothetical protein
MLKLSAKAIKVTLVVDPGLVISTKVPCELQRVTFGISAADRVLRGECATPPMPFTPTRHWAASE